MREISRRKLRLSPFHEEWPGAPEEVSKRKIQPLVPGGLPLPRLGCQSVSGVNDPARAETAAAISPIPGKKSPSPSIQWNDEVKLIISDVDETVADLYTGASPEMLSELSSLLEEGRVILFITGSSMTNVTRRIVNGIEKQLRPRILVGHCGGAELWGFDANGGLRLQPYYSVYTRLFNNYRRRKWREVIQQVVAEFGFVMFPPMPVAQFQKKSGGDPLAILFEDRGPQITFEMPNSYCLSAEQLRRLRERLPAFTLADGDLREPVARRAAQLLEKARVPIIPRLAGIFAIDFVIQDITKGTAVRYLMENKTLLASFGFSEYELMNPAKIEVWGNKFSVANGGMDRFMCEALPGVVRTVDFRHEDPAELPKGFRIEIWDGEYELHDGLLEYLQTRR